jgi:hypothetical protein
MSPRMGAKGIQAPTAPAAMKNCWWLSTFAQQAMNVLTTHESATADTTFTPCALVSFAPTKCATCFEHYASPMVHLTTGKTISSYKKLMNDMATVEVWQTAFGKDFGGMAQGCNKAGQKGTNAMFVMTSGYCKCIGSRQKITYANPVVDHHPQKEDPNRIQKTAGGNLIQCDLELSVYTADINTAKLHWNSVVSMENAKCMCLDIKNFYLTAAFEYYKYMRIPLSYFPEWTIKQYKLLHHVYNG